MSLKADDRLRCSFCGKSQNEVKKLIAGPTVYICDECVDICNEIIADGEAAGAQKGAGPKEETTAGAPSSSTERVSCPACATPLVLSLTVKPDGSEGTEIKHPPANPPKA
jgi:hypothetical protein